MNGFLKNLKKSLKNLEFFLCVLSRFCACFIQILKLFRDRVNLSIMKRTKRPQITKAVTKKKKRRKPGPKSKCTEEVIQKTFQLCLLGLTNRQLAGVFNVSEDSITYWYKTKPRFRQAVDDGRTHADSEAAKALYRKALGYEHQAVKFFKDRVTEKEYDEEGNVIFERSYTRIIKQPYTKKYPPDTKALIKWLGVRNREYWGESYKVQHRHEHSHMLQANVNIHQILEQISDTSKVTDEELRVAAKLGLNKAVNQITNGSHN